MKERTRMVPDIGIWSPNLTTLAAWDILNEAKLPNGYKVEINHLTDCIIIINDNDTLAFCITGKTIEENRHLAHFNNTISTLISMTDAGIVLYGS